MNEKILVTEDSVITKRQLIDILNENGYTNIIEAANGTDAVDKYMRENPDLVLLDLMMKKMEDPKALDGLEALKKIMDIDMNAKVIIISAIGQQSVVNECMKVGARKHIVKPIDEDTVIREIREVLG